MKQLLNNHKTLIVIIVTVLVILIAIYLWGKKAGKRVIPKPVKLPHGVDIPTGWTPGIPVRKLYYAMDGWGTDYDSIKEALSNLNSAQKIAVYNEFNRKYSKNENDDLLSWFRDDLSGRDLEWALMQFQGIL